MPEDSTQVLYDNSSEPGFQRLQEQRRYRLLASITVIVAGMIIVTAVFSPGSPHDVGSTALWLVALSLLILLLVGGLFVDVRRGLSVRVTRSGILVSPDEWFPAEILQETRFEERPGFFVVKSERTNRPLFSVDIRDIANLERFKAAMEELRRRS